MKTLPRILMVFAVGALMMLFLFPMWRITLYAPQYPDGVTMYIWINKLEGETPGTIQNINILNHYVGMKYIEPDAIPELKYFPTVILAMGFLGLLAAGLNRYWGYWVWAVLFGIMAALGMYDFYLWEYDYGHSLSDTAPIKIPGASFQPPLIGTKDILNFVAESYPHTGGYLAGLAGLLALGAGWLSLRFKKKAA